MNDSMFGGQTIFDTRDVSSPAPVQPDKVGGSLYHALAADSSLASVIGFGDDFTYSPDPLWQLNDTNFEHYTQGIAPQYWPQFGYAVSEEHALAIRDRMMTQQWADQRMAQSGAWTIPGKIGFSFMDPPQFAAMVATGGVGTVGNIAVKGERLAAAVRAGLVGAGINAGLTAIESTQKPTVDANDVLRSGLMGFGFGVAGPMTAGQSRTARFLKGAGYSAAPTLAYDAAGRITGLSDTDKRDMLATALQNAVMGGVFNSLHATRPITEVESTFARDVLMRDEAATIASQKFAQSLYKSIKFRDIADAARASGKTVDEALTPKGKEFFSDELAALQHNRAAEPITPGADFPGRAIGAAAANDPGFIANRPVADGRPPKLPGDLFVQYPTDAMPRFGKVARLGLDTAGFAPDGPQFGPMREAYNLTMYDPVPKVDGTLGGEASTWSYGQRTARHAELNRLEIEAYAKHKEWAKANNQKPLSLEDFGDRVTEHRRSQGKLWGNDEGVAYAASHLNRFYPEELGRQQRHGVSNAENVADNPWYTSRAWNDHLVDMQRNRAGHEGLRNGIAKAIIGDLPEGRKLAIAEALLRRQLNRFFGTPTSRGGILDADAEALTAAIKEANPNLSDSDIHDIVYYKADTAPDGTPKWLRRRIALDENAAMDLVDQGTGEKYQAPVHSLLYNNAFELARRYSDHSIGSSTLAELFHAYARGNEKVPTSIPQFLDLLKGRMEANGVPIDQYQHHLNRIETALKRIGGLPVRKRGDFDHVLEAIGNLQFTRTMSNLTSGIQNLQQVGEALANVNLDVALKSVPEIANLRDMIRRTDGKLDNRFLRELEAMTIADGPMARRPRMYMPDDGSLSNPSVARKAAYWTSRASKVASVASGQDHAAKINAYAAGIAYKNTWGDMVFGGRSLETGQNLQRLKDSGLTVEMGKRIAAMIEKHAQTETGSMGRKVKSFEVSDWVEDPEAASAFNIRMGRFVERVTGEGNPTAEHLWMSNPMAKLLLQLRKYGQRQWTGKTLWAADQARQGRYTDLGRVAVTTTAWAAALYMARVYVQSIGREDREQYLEQMLAHDKVALGAIGRNDTASLLPWMIDVGALGTGAKEPVFAFARASEMREAGGRFQKVFGSPTTAWLESVYGTTSALGGSAFHDDYVFSKDDLKNVGDALAVPNIFNFKVWAQRELARQYGLPARSRPR